MVQRSTWKVFEKREASIRFILTVVSSFLSKMILTWCPSTFLVASATPSTVDLPTNNKQVEGIDGVVGVALATGRVGARARRPPIGRLWCTKKREVIGYFFTVRKLSNFEHLWKRWKIFFVARSAIIILKIEVSIFHRFIKRRILGLNDENPRNSNISSFNFNVHCSIKRWKSIFFVNRSTTILWNPCCIIFFFVVSSRVKY